MPWIVETKIGSVFQNIWTDCVDGVEVPTVFATEQLANEAIAEHNADLAKAGMEEMEVRVVEVVA